MSQASIAVRLSVSTSAISQLKIHDGDWDDYKLPPISAQDLLDNLEQILFKMQVENLAEKDMDIETMTRFSLNFDKLTSALVKSQELLEVVSIRNTMLSMQNFMEWLVKHPYKDPLDAAQAYYDEQLDKL